MCNFTSSLTHCSKSSFFVQKFNFDFPNKIVDFLEVKNSSKCCDFGLFSCWQLWFHEKNCQKDLGEKLVKMFEFCRNWIFEQKFDFSNSVWSEEEGCFNLEFLRLLFFYLTKDASKEKVALLSQQYNFNLMAISFEKMNRNVQELCQDIPQSLEEKVLVHAAVLLRKKGIFTSGPDLG